MLGNNLGQFESRVEKREMHVLLFLLVSDPNGDATIAVGGDRRLILSGIEKIAG